MRNLNPERKSNAYTAMYAIRPIHSARSAGWELMFFDGYSIAGFGNGVGHAHVSLRKEGVFVEVSG
jgi:hypothetical protein